jgi:hypothetical protein
LLTTKFFASEGQKWFEPFLKSVIGKLIWDMIYLAWDNCESGCSNAQSGNERNSKLNHFNFANLRARPVVEGTRWLFALLFQRKYNNKDPVHNPPPSM